MQGDILVISDMHLPYQHPGCLDFLADLKRRWKPERVVCIGDEVDFHRLSTHTQEPGLLSVGEEVREAVKLLRKLYVMFPEVMVCNSNHGSRLYKRAKDAGICSGWVKSLAELLEAPEGWAWRDFWDVGGIHFRHGDGFSGKNAALIAAEKVRRNVAIGHVHTAAGVQYSGGHFGTVWGMSVGCLIDPAREAFGYAKFQASRPVLGTGYVLGGTTPIFLPLEG